MLEKSQPCSAVCWNGELENNTRKIFFRIPFHLHTKQYGKYYTKMHKLKHILMFFSSSPVFVATMRAKIQLFK